MRVEFELTRRLSEMAGHRGGGVELADGATIDEALRTLVGQFAGRESAGLISNGDLHPAVLVTVDGESCPPEARGRALSGRETIGLLLPVAGG
jgi:hypothetical protein